MPKKNIDSILKTIAYYSSSKIYQQLLGLITAFVKPNFLSPAQYGLWNFLSVIPTYATYFHFGSPSSIRHRIPYHEARQEYEVNEKLKSTVFIGTMYLSFFLAVVLSGIAVLSNYTLEIRIGLITMAIVIMLEWYYSFYITVLKSYQDYNLITRTNFLKATITCLLTISLVILFGLYGIYMTVVLAMLVVLFYLHRHYPFKNQQSFSIQLFYQLVKQGFPIMMFALIIMLIQTSDRLIITYYLGMEQLGYYGIAILALNFLQNIPASSREVIEPKIMQSKATHSKEQTIIEYFFKPLVNMAFYMPFLIVPVFFLLPVIIPIILPDYVYGILPSQILLIGTYFLSLSLLTRGMIAAYSLQVKGAMIMTLSLLLNLILNIFFIKSGFGINGVALGSSVSFFTLFVSLVIFLRLKCNYVLEQWRRNLLVIVQPFLFMCVMIVLLSFCSRVIPEPYQFLSAIINPIIFCVALFFYINRVNKNISLLRKIELPGIFSSPLK